MNFTENQLRNTLLDRPASPPYERVYYAIFSGTLPNHQTLMFCPDSDSEFYLWYRTVLFEGRFAGHDKLIFVCHEAGVETVIASYNRYPSGIEWIDGRIFEVMNPEVKP